MNRQLILTLFWLLSFAAALGVVESYIQVVDSNGKTVLIAEDRVDAMKPLIVLYSSYLVAILGFWFIKPFVVPESFRRWRRHRFAIALICTAFVNGVVLYLISQEYVAGNRQVLEDITAAVTLAGLLSFVVAPINAYYFGAKS